jgi:hypothetical protein
MSNMTDRNGMRKDHLAFSRLGFGNHASEQEGMVMATESYNYDTFRRHRRHMMKEDMHFRGGPEPGTIAPDFDLPSVQGGRFRLTDC